MLGGIANYIHEVASALSAQGDVDVRVIARTMPGDSEFDRHLNYEVHRIVASQTAILSLPAFTKAVIENIRQWKPTKILGAQWFPDAAAIYAAVKLSGTQIPYTLMSHGSEIFDSRQNLRNEFRHWLLYLLRARVLEGAEKIFTVSNFTSRSMMAKYNLPASRFIATMAGVNTQIYKKKRESIKNNGDSPLLLTVSRLQAYKGIDKVIAALPTVLETFPKLRYWIAGTGPDQARLEQLVSELHLENTVKLLGPQKLEEIVDLYNQADLFLLLTRQDPPDVEGFGLVFLEAAACGLPALGGRSGGIPEAVEEGRSGWLVDPVDTSAIAEKIKMLLSSPEELQRASAYSLSVASQKTWREVGLRFRAGLTDQS